MTSGLVAVVVHRRRPQSCVVTGRLLLAEGVERLVVVDNGSPPADVAAIRRGLPEAEVVELAANTGFGPAANVGLRRWLAEGDAAGEWALVCPHDARPVPGCVARLVAEAAARPRAGLASAEYGGDDPLSLPVVDPYFGGILARTGRTPGWEDAGHPHGTLLLARRACLREIGLFDERYFAYCEEADLGERARRAGWEVGVVWGAVVANPGMSSAPGVAEYLMLRNSILLVRRLFGRYRASVRFAMATWATLQGAVRPSRRTPFWDLRARLLALRDAALGRDGPPPPGLGQQVLLPGPEAGVPDPARALAGPGPVGEEAEAVVDAEVVGPDRQVPGVGP